MLLGTHLLRDLPSRVRERAEVLNRLSHELRKEGDSQHDQLLQAVHDVLVDGVGLAAGEDVGEIHEALRGDLAGHGVGRVQSELRKRRHDAVPDQPLLNVRQHGEEREGLGGVLADALVTRVRELVDLRNDLELEQLAVPAALAGQVQDAAHAVRERLAVRRTARELDQGL